MSVEHIYHCSKWQSQSGFWYCSDTENLASISAKWWIPARMLNISLPSYVLLLINEYHAVVKEYYSDTDVLIFYWREENKSDCDRYMRFINTKARELKYLV